MSRLAKEECHTAMLHNDMDICRLKVYAQQIEESKLRKMNRDGKRHRSNEPSQPKSKKRFYNQDSSVGIKDSVPNHNYQGGSGGGYTHERPKCTTCGKQHLDKCIVGKDGYFGCGIRGHKMRDFPVLIEQGK